MPFPLILCLCYLLLVGVGYSDWSLLKANGLVWIEEIWMILNSDTHFFTLMAVAYYSFVFFSVDHMDYRCPEFFY